MIHKILRPFLLVAYVGIASILGTFGTVLWLGSPGGPGVSPETHGYLYALLDSTMLLWSADLLASAFFALGMAVVGGTAFRQAALAEDDIGRFKSVAIGGAGTFFVFWVSWMLLPPELAGGFDQPFERAVATGMFGFLGNWFGAVAPQAWWWVEDRLGWSGVGERQDADAPP